MVVVQATVVHSGIWESWLTIWLFQWIKSLCVINSGPGLGGLRCGVVLEPADGMRNAMQKIDRMLNPKARLRERVFFI